MEISSEVLASCAVVRPVGTLDRRTAPQLEAALQALADKGHGRIVLDLSGVSEMSSAGLRVIISAAKLLRNERTDGDLRLVAPGERVIQVLELAGLQSVLRVYRSTDQAIASFDQPTAPGKNQKPRKWPPECGDFRSLSSHPFSSIPSCRTRRAPHGGF